jgi:hypothetical protein
VSNGTAVIPEIPDVSGKENNSNKVSTISGNETNTTKYPNTKAVADALGKWGVISQTQTWSGTGTNPRTYVMSDLTRGIIPNDFIDRALSHEEVVFNDTSGYFELNGLTDISYKEMIVILENFPVMTAILGGSPSTGQIIKGRTNIPLKNTGTIPLNYAFFRSPCEVISFNVGGGVQTSNNIANISREGYKLKVLKGLTLSATTSTSVDRAFENCYSLETVNIRGIKISLSFSNSSPLSLESVVYMVENAANTSAITITLHADALARCTADTTEYTYNGNTYTGIVALATAKNITLASA